MFTAWLSAMGLGAVLAVPTSAHCALMCGPIAMQARGVRRSLAYFFGRLASYVLLGSLAGAFGRALLALTSLIWIEAAASWLIALVLAFSAARLFRKPRALAPTQIGKKGKVSLVSQAFARLADEPFLLGAFTALLPCGALYAALLLAASLSSPVAGALAMFAFATITGLGLVGVGVLSERLTPRRHGQRWLALALVAGALITLWRPLTSFEGHPPSCPLHQGAR